MKRSLLALFLAISFAGCQFENRPDGGNPDHTGADNAEQDAYEATTGSQGAVPAPRADDAASTAQEALGGAPASPAPAEETQDMLPPPTSGAPASPPPPSQ
ncbi:hypothetical protein [Rubricoccus marinus]|uniref:Lipoprotein n=1 Tax=Rubricoccus marinus TaxID=716817 RepID=A0A259U1V2_9BACT|nr:hypothetical protein [Rubricoccus marinus]OZC03962.1 hypothetical protein BSZ36_13805 [Rubricoccus marinus]